MNLKISPKEIVKIKQKGVNVDDFQSVRRHWSNQLKEIRTTFDNDRKTT